MLVGTIDFEWPSSRISSYSPSDATKTFERPVSRKNVPQFEPKCTIANMKRPPSRDTEESRKSMVEQYLHVSFKPEISRASINLG